ncbi:MAG: NAD-dependent epimerase/dehydratase family protein [Pseudomonadales bacterium]|nr:NAD-dependent epimerase/dehydratase family protein [Pseudomonadales bacterium]
MSSMTDAGSDAINRHAGAGIKVLVTGASGFIGGHLLPHLLMQGFIVTTLSRRADAAPALRGPGLRVLTANLDQPATLAAACAGQDLIIHLAGQAHVIHSQPRQLWDSNVDGTGRLLTAAIAADVKKFVFISSVKAATPRSHYGNSKLAAEKLLLAAHQAGRIQVCCLRPTAVYGAGMKGNLRAWMKLQQKGLAPPLPPHAGRLEMIGVDDLCEAIIKAATTPACYGRVYTLSDGRIYRLKAIEDALRASLGKARKRWYLPQFMYYIAAGLGELLARGTGLNSGFGWNSYHTLFDDDCHAGDDFAQATGFRASTSFYDELPTLQAGMTGVSPTRE